LLLTALAAAGDMEVVETSIPEQRVSEDGIKFPLVLSPGAASTTHAIGDVVHYLRANKSELLAKISSCGVILFRGFNIRSPQDYLDFLNAWDFEFGSYVGGGGPRNVILGPIHTSTETPPHVKINFHHELAYLTTFPTKLSFWCDIPAAADGETPVLLSSRLVKKLSERNKAFVDRVRKKKIRYTRTIDDQSKCNNQYQRSWQEAFDTTDRAEAEARALLVGHEQVSWNEDGSMTVISKPLDGIHAHPKTGEETWFNAVVLLYAGDDPQKQKLYNTTYGDGSPIESRDIKDAQEVMDEEGVMWPWQKNDVILIDNLTALHARSTFTPPRRILAAIISSEK